MATTMTTRRAPLVEGVESERFTATRMPERLPSLDDLSRMTVTNAIQAVLLNAGRPLTVFEITADLRKRNYELKPGQYDLFTFVHRTITSAPKEMYGFQKV